MKRMLFNATQAEELRVAIVDGQKLIDLDIESAAKEQKKSNIYKAVITHIEPSLEAAFVDYGAERNGFLPFKEISRSYFQEGVDARASIKEALRENQELIVQVEKDERGNKGAAMTTFISLAGRYLVLMPNNPRGGGVSRRVEGEDRNELRALLEQLEVPQGMSLIARTAAIGRSIEELQWDLNYQLQLWKAITTASVQEKAPSLIYQEDTLVIRAIRDYFQPDIGEILIDTDEVFEQARKFMSYVMPEMPNRIKRYRDDVPLFSRFQIEHQIESAYSREVSLPSGGAIVIDHTEALVSVDVNSGRSTRGADIEETAFKTNLEAAEEIARQLRLRDLGGLVVIDFIDMEISRNQREVESRLRENLRLDRARVQTSKISRFGLMELSRQRLRPALEESSYITCPRCSGTGHIRSAESAALHILRILEEEAMKENTAAIQAQIPVDVATFLFNEKRYDLQAIELRHKVGILLIPNTHLNPPQHSIARYRHDELDLENPPLPSYKRVDVPEETDARQSAAGDHPPRQEAAIKGITITPQSAPIPKAPEQKAPEKEGILGGFISKIASWFGKENVEEEAAPTPPPHPEKKTRGGGRRGERRRVEDREPKAPRGDREPKAPRGDREQKELRGDREQKEARGDREPKEARGDREPKDTRRRNGEGKNPRAKAKEAVTVPETAPPIDDSGEKPTEESTPRRRGRRGGRRERGEGRESAASAEKMQDAQEAAPPVAPASDAVTTSPEAAQNLRPPKTAPLPEETETPLLEAPEPQLLLPLSTPAVPEVKASEAADVPETPPTEVAPPSTAKAEEEPVAELEADAPVESPETSGVELRNAITTSGLVMVETDSVKLAEFAPEEEPKPRAPRRRRTTAAPAPAEPLVMVETRHPVQESGDRKQETDETDR